VAKILLQSDGPIKDGQDTNTAHHIVSRHLAAQNNKILDLVALIVADMIQIDIPFAILTADIPFQQLDWIGG
jgi:hypothetical protein